MTSISIVQRDGTEKTIEAQDGISLMESIRARMDELLAMCGGSCSCATCHVIVDDAWIDKIGRAEGDEADLLYGSSYSEDNSRLSCQITVSPQLEGMRVTIAPED